MCDTSNPFSARFVRPGAIPYQFLFGGSETELLHRLGESGWRGQIVGPHGSGKSALVASLIPVLRRAGWEVRLYELHDRQRRLTMDQFLSLTSARECLIIVDGFEQLSWWNRRRLTVACRRGRHGLVVTAHRSMGFPDLYRTTTSVELARRLAKQCLGANAPLIHEEEITDRFHRYEGNLRETLFALYDLFEARQARRNQGGS